MQLPVSYLALAVFEIVVIVVAVIDARTKRIPNWCMIVLLCVWAVSAAVNIGASCFAGMPFVDALFAAVPPVGISVANAVAAALVFGGGSLLLTLLLERLTGAFAFGGGDIKLLFVAGLFLGIQREAIALLIACAAFLLFALVAKRVRKQDRSDSQPLAFGPFIAAGCVLSLITLF